ncbi:DnaB-like helicase C-terminal domain-containing protein, partial [Streptomyces sp. PT12]|uniref:DnaB-like helicase C-terminal domain-containing protein n=1 Tax=Streptomyces sp. PT12 TaxID=1510197 RepID=UPI000DE1D396
GAEPAAAPPRRHLASLAEALAALPPTLPGLPIGITALDQALGGLQPGRFYLVAGAPGAGASLLATTAARTTALTGNLPVLYAASGLTSADVLARVIAAHTPVDYRRLRAGTLDPNERQAVADTTQLLNNAPLFIDDGTELDTTAIASTVPDVPHLALLVIDRLQAAHDPRLPLSGAAGITDAVQALAHLARTRHLSVLAALDTDDPALLQALAADLTLTLTRKNTRTQLTIRERDLGDLADVVLTADLTHARFTDYVESDPYAGIKPLTQTEIDAITPFPNTDDYSSTGRTPGFDPAHAFSSDQGRQVTADLAAAVRPYLDQPAALEQLPPDLRDVLPTLVRLLDTPAASNQRNSSPLSAVQEAVTGAAACHPRLPATAPNRHLQAALDAFYAHARAHGYAPPAAPPTPPPTAPRPASALPSQTPEPTQAVPGPAPRPATPSDAAPRNTTYAGRNYSHFTQMITTAVQRALEEHGGDPEAATEALSKQAIPNGMALFEATRVGGNYEHTVYPETLEFLRKKTKDGADEIWEGRHKWEHTQIMDAIGRGTLTDLTVTVLDTNASYLSAFKTHLPIGALQHNPNGGFDPKRSGIYRLPDRPTWNHPDLPDPIGNRREQGPILLDDATIRLLIRCAKLGLCEPPHITESWTSGATEGLLEKFRRVLTQARETAILNDDDVTYEYIKAMYSKFVSTIGESSVNRDIRRPDWMHIIRSQAFANLWYKAHRAHKKGLTIVRLRGTDELHITATDTDWRTVFNEGRLTTELKNKDQYTLPRSRKSAR